LTRSYALELGIAAVCVTVLLGQVQPYMPFFVDDSFIALRYAWRFLHGQGLTWTDGERVEGYSDLLWVLLEATGGLFSKDLVAVSRTLGVTATLATVCAILYAYHPRRAKEAIAPLVASLAMVLTFPVVAWSIGGLEQPLLAALVAWATVLAYRFADGTGDERTASKMGLLLGLVGITRPDGALFTVAICMGLLPSLGFGERFRKVGGRIVLLAGSFFVVQLLFRRVYYHAWVPNTAHVKLALTKARVLQGWQYVAGTDPYLRALLLLAIVALGAAMTRPESRKRVAFPVASALAWTAYVIVIGGDISPAHRHLVVTIVLLSLVAAEGLHALVALGGRWIAIAGAFGTFALVMLARGEREDPDRGHVLDDTWVWSGREVGRFLSRAFAADQPLVAVDAAGALPYFAPELPCLDMLGLNDRTLANIHPADFGTGFLGHELGNGAYILGRKPDLVVFHTSLGDEEPMWRGGREMKDSPEFARLYKLVTFQTREGVQTRIWVRQEDSRVGIKRTDREVNVPGYLLDASPGAVAALSSDERVGLRIDKAHGASRTDLALGPGRWVMRIEGSGEVDAGVWRRGRRNTILSTTPDEIRIEQGQDARVSMVVTLRSGYLAYLYRVVFEKAGR